MVDLVEMEAYQVHQIREVAVSNLEEVDLQVEEVGENFPEIGRFLVEAMDLEVVENFQIHHLAREVASFSAVAEAQ